MNGFAKRRITLGMTVTELAAKVGVYAATVSNWESGRFQPKPKYYAKLAESLKLTPEQVADLVTEVEASRKRSTESPRP